MNRRMNAWKNETTSSTMIVYTNKLQNESRTLFLDLKL